MSVEHGSDVRPGRHRGRSRGQRLVAAAATVRVPVSRDGTDSFAGLLVAGRVPCVPSRAAGLGAALVSRLSHRRPRGRGRAGQARCAGAPALHRGGPQERQRYAISISIAALTATELHTVRIDETIAALRSVVEHRDDLVKARTQTVNRLHALLTGSSPRMHLPS